MDQFLQQSKSHLDRLSQMDAVCVVLGNEACDLDSAVSALAYARFLDRSRPFGPVNIPVLNVAREDYSLKTEVVHFLGKCNLSQHLIFRDEIDLKSMQERGQLRLVLVDHNVPCHSDADLDAAVVRVVDHHKLERGGQAGVAVRVEAVGSCSTLVASQIFDEAADLLDATLATLLLGTIVLDTVNFCPSAKRATALDADVAERLQRLVPHVSRRDLYAQLQSAKEDVRGLSLEQLLRKDLKDVPAPHHPSHGQGRVAVSSVPGSAARLLEDAAAGLASRLQAFCDERRYVGLVIVGVDIDRDQNAAVTIRRDLAVYAACGDLMRRLRAGVEECDQPPLRLAAAPLPAGADAATLALYRQDNAAASRKAILPALKRALATTLEGGSSGLNDSAPDTPSNSCADDADLRQRHLPSLLTERLESADSTAAGVGVVDDADGLSSTAYPFTPKNSFVDGGGYLDDGAYQRFALHRVDDVEAALNEKLSREKFFHDDDDDDDDVYDPDVYDQQQPPPYL